MPKIKLTKASNTTSKTSKDVKPPKVPSKEPSKRPQTKPKEKSTSVSVFDKHRPVDNICQASVKYQTKKSARDQLMKDASAELYIRSYKDGDKIKEGIFKRCQKTRKDGVEYCWKHSETVKNNKHPVINFQRDIIEQLGKTVRKAVLTDPYMNAGSLSSRKAKEAQIVSTQPVFQMNVDIKLLSELKEIHKQLSDILERGSVDSDDDAFGKLLSSNASVSASISDKENELSKSDSDSDSNSNTDADTDADTDKEDEEVVEVDVIYSNTGTKYIYDEKTMNLLELDGTVIGQLYKIGDDRAPFTINDEKYIVKQDTKVAKRPHIRCKLTNLVYDMSHTYVGKMICDDDGKKRLSRE